MNNNRLGGGLCRLLLVLMPVVMVAGCAGTDPAPPPEPRPAAEPPAQATTSALDDAGQAPAQSLDGQRRPETEAPRLAAEHPMEYTVKRGDTLWDIAARFLRDPWLWPEIWYLNPAISNPHLIYPGDVIELIYVDGRPRLQVRETARDAVRLSPKVRKTGLQEAIPAIPYETIEPFLAQPRLVTEQELVNAAYVLRPFESEQLMLGAGDRAYIRGDVVEGERYHLVRRGDPLIDPQDGDLLGYEAVYLGDLRIQRGGDPGIGLVTRSKREITKGDRLLAADDGDPKPRFVPAAPDTKIDGRIVSLYDGISQVGRYQIVALNRGSQAGLAQGHVLAVFQHGGVAEDPHTEEMISLPERRAGEVMVFRVFDEVSYALVMRASRGIGVGDIVRQP